MSNWKRVTKHDPCFGCGKPDFCRYSDDGGVECKRGAFPGSHERLDKNGVTHWVGGRLGDGKHQKPTQAFVEETNPEPATPAALNRVYKELVDQLGLCARHYDALAGRGFSHEAIKRHEFRTLERTGRGRIALHLADLFPFWMSIPGLYVREDCPWLGGMNGLLIPCRNPEGQIIGMRVRPDDPGEGGKYRWLSSSGRGGPSPGSQASLWRPTRPILEPGTIRITEGELKAARLAEGTGINTISAPGVQALACDQVLAWLSVLQAKQILLCPDKDMKQNRVVASAVRTALEKLKALSLPLKVEVW